MSRISVALSKQISLRSKLVELFKTNPFQLSKKLKSENVIVEFGSPNIAKPLHMGHLRSTVTGHFVTKICKAAGHKVTSMCFLGDWGTQFGVLHAGLEKWVPREEDQPLMKTVHKLSLQELLEYYVRAVKETETNESFAKETRKFSLALEQQERSAIDVWATVREKTVNHLGTVWNQLGIHYDVLQGESEFAVASDHTEETMAILKEMVDLETSSDGCIFAKLSITSKKGSTNEVKVPLVKADGSSLYLLRDIAAARKRLEKFQFDRMIYVVDIAQSNHFINLFNILSQIGLKKSSSGDGSSIEAPNNFLQHVSFGRVEGMSTRKGNFILLSDVIEDGTELMEENRTRSSNTRRNLNPESDKIISMKLALSALIINSLKIRRNRDCKFDWTLALKPTGDTGVRLQYTHARLVSLEKKIITTSINDSDDFDMDYILQDQLANDLAAWLIKFEDAFWESYDELEPCTIVQYLFKLCDKVSRCLKELKVQSEPNQEIAKTRLKLFILARKILAFGLDALGIEPLDEI